MDKYLGMPSSKICERDNEKEKRSLSSMTHYGVSDIKLIVSMVSIKPRVQISFSKIMHRIAKKIFQSAEGKQTILITKG